MDLAAQLRTALLAHSLPLPSPPFLTHLISSRQPPPPLPSLLATAKARLLSADLSTSPILSDIPPLPTNVDDASVKESRLRGDVHVQVLDVENLSASRWEQIEELEAVERGERTRGRQVVRLSDEHDNASQNQSQWNEESRNQSRGIQGQNQRNQGKGGTHRLVLQDARGKRVYAVELVRIPRVGVGKTFIGEKILLKSGTTVARGTILLAPDTCVFLGGKIDAWHDAWTRGRLARLKEAVA